MIYKILTVFALASFEMYVAIPTGFAMKLTSWQIFFTCLAGGLTGVFVAAFLGEKIKQFFAKYKKPKPADYVEKTDTLAHKLWKKYGTIGLGYIGSITVGPPISIAVGLGLNANFKQLIFWCCLGVLTRCIAFTFFGNYVMQYL